MNFFIKQSNVDSEPGVDHRYKNDTKFLFLCIDLRLNQNDTFKSPVE